MAVIFALILLAHIPTLYENGGVIVANVLFASFIGYKALSVRKLKPWPLWLRLSPLPIFLLDIWNGPDLKSAIFLIYLLGLLFVFPNMRYSQEQLAEDIRGIVYVSLAFLGLFMLMNIGQFGSFNPEKDVYWYPLATPNLVGVLSVIVIVLSFENGYHWSIRFLGIASLAFMPLILGVILALVVYAAWRLHRYLKLLVLPFAAYIVISLWDPTLLGDTSRLDSLTSLRYSIWAESIELTNERPMTGYGHEQWPLLLGNFVNPHNFIFYFLLSYGYFVGGLLVWVTVYLFRSKRESQSKSTVKTQAAIFILVVYQLVYVGNIGHFSTFGNVLTLLFGLNLISTLCAPSSRVDKLRVASPFDPKLPRRVT